MTSIIPSEIIVIGDLFVDTIISALNHPDIGEDEVIQTPVVEKPGKADGVET